MARISLSVRAFVGCLWLSGPGALMSAIAQVGTDTKKTKSQNKAYQRSYIFHFIIYSTVGYILYIETLVKMCYKKR